MKPLETTSQNVAELLGGRVEGDSATELSRLASLASAGAGELTFASSAKHVSALRASAASAAIVPDDLDVGDVSLTLIRVADMDRAIATLLGDLCDAEDLPAVGVHPSAVVDETARLAEGVRIGPGAVVGANATVGANTALCAGAVLGRDVLVGQDCVLCENAVVRQGCELGDEVRIGPSSVVGYDGFGYFFRDGKHNKVPHAGNVVIESGVELGACSCVDRGKFGSTRVGAGTKVDNLVQIAHNVQVGPACILVSQVGIAGSTTLGTGVVLGGSTGIRDNIHLADGVQVAAYAAVANDLEAGKTYAGVPAKEARNAYKEMMALGRLPDALKRIRQLEKQIRALESRLKDE
ncbi:MAG: UDP-3-O-(3-hydroxymyristoyl)glucosamine N-acyltransferase [Phycisphaerales bacterium]|jgi:UDP-3-O-[3-hydroxymyristoyl] glucosamine N-acyltransferase|nr:UDP-3-O-(3-hydroxymyristoyl)glucosamine N-acyltransferase [Phycisphaerales bacterium]MBT7171174.1 UDP-3-O-(3-hydroxymyristoyl)glucosamine N-acyltransferase [Phycisphaerales bacterium]